MNDSDVLIVGAGPTGLVLALWLTKQSVKVRIIDKTYAPGTTSRALAVHARTLELYRQLDLTAAVLAKGHEVPAINLWVKGRRAAHVSFTDTGGDFTPYPFAHIFPQDEHERLLIERLEGMGIRVERETEIIGFSDCGDHVTAEIRHRDSAVETCTASYIAGCDGAHSLVRQIIGGHFPGGTYRQLFYVADAEASGDVADGELHIDLDEADFLAVFPLAAQRRIRLIGTIRDDRVDHPETLRFEDVSNHAINHLKIKIEKVNWFSTYRVHHRVTDHFRKGRAFLLGDAAHIHSPAGGQGMNTGIGDAVNLAWKLAAVLQGRASDPLLDSFEAERIGFARRLVETTDRAFSFATAEGHIADFVRTKLAPLVVPALAHAESIRRFMFRTVSQLTISYRNLAISRGQAGRVHGGDRLPWIVVDGRDNYDSLREIAWRVQVYGRDGEGLSQWCAAHHLPLEVFTWHEKYAEAGLAENAIYLLRPDTYVALAESSGASEALERYFKEVAINPTS